MRPTMFLTILSALFVLLVGASVALGDDLPPGPTVVYRAQFKAVNPPSYFDVVNLVLDFAPNAWTPMHTHGGQGMVTVLEGEITHRPQGQNEQKLKAGQTFFETPGNPHAAGNGTDQKTRVIFTDLLPKGFPLTTVQGTNTDLPSGPSTVFRTTLEVTDPPAEYDVINLVLDFAPGAWTPAHTHGGHGIVTVLEGEITHRPQGQAEQKLKPGQSFIETPGSPHIAGNATTQNARVLFTVLLPTGATLTTLEEAHPVTLPQTGGDEWVGRVWLLIIAGLGLISGGWLLRRRMVWAK